MGAHNLGHNQPLFAGPLSRYDTIRNETNDSPLFRPLSAGSTIGTHHGTAKLQVGWKSHHESLFLVFRNWERLRGGKSCAACVFSLALPLRTGV